MKIKSISKILTFGILLNSIPINSFASTLSEDTRHETFKGSNITINDVLEEDKTDIKIEGNTLVNLCLEDTSKGVLIENEKNKRMDGSLLKKNTEYTFIFDIEENNLDENSRFVIELHTSMEPKIRVKQNIYGRIVEKIRTYDDIELILWISGTGNVLIKNLMILEGDWTNREIPGYFKGLKSSFEDQLVTQEMVDSGIEKAENLGKYKVEYRVTGKNKSPSQNINYFYYDAPWWNGYSIVRKVNSNTAFTSDLIKVEPNTTYTYSATNKSRSAVHFFKNIDDELPYSGTSKGVSGEPFTFTTDSECEYIRIYLGADSELPINIQLEEGSIATEYEPYKESIKTFYLNSPLLEGDTIEDINGQAYHVHRSEKKSINGSENWVHYTDSSVDIKDVAGSIGYASLFVDNLYVNLNENTVLCDKFIGVKGKDYDYNKEMIYAWNKYGNITQHCLYIHLYCSNLTTSSLTGFKEYLSKNPIVVVYKLANPIYEPIKTDLSANLFEGKTYISNNSNIPATMEVTVDRTINRATEAVELAKTNPTIENLSKARYWNNLLRDSIKKEQFQEELNNITNISDMELEKKINTSNLDVYIKSENILQMSLDTNSISFDDFSGIENVEKINAVNVTINSSLPYQINAYLPNEIQNADKTKTLDKSILNIKENGESEYKEFININEKVVLKDNCSAGNQLTHGVDLKLAGGIAHEKDIYKATIKLEVEQK